MRQNIADFLYSNFLGRTSQKKHPVHAFFYFLINKLDNLAIPEERTLCECGLSVCLSVR